MRLTYHYNCYSKYIGLDWLAHHKLMLPVFFRNIQIQIQIHLLIKMYGSH
jgi:hypothetical protein